MADERKSQGQTGDGPAEAERVAPPAFIPAVDIFETTDGAVLVADLPGCDVSNVDIRYEDGVLTLTGRVKPDEVADHELTYSEYRVGDFERTFSVSELVDPAKIQASVKDGVLRVLLPKTEESKPKKIQIMVG